MQKRILVGLFALWALLLSGCSSVPSLAQINEDLASLHARAQARRDADTAASITRVSGVLSFRTPSLSDKPKTVAALQQACARGQFVEVIVFAGDAPAVRALKGTCLPLYLTDNPQVGQGDAVLLVDSVRMVVDGDSVPAKEGQVRQEYAFRNFVKSTATRIN